MLSDFLTVGDVFQMIKGYARVSTEEQNLLRQIERLESAGCQVIYQEKTTGAHTNRPELQRMLGELQPSDVVIVHELDRISRSTRDLLNLVDIITEKGASLKSLSESWLDTTSDNPYNEFLLTVMAGVAQLERKMLRKRQKEGIDLAKRLGKYRGRIPKYTDKHLGMRHALSLYATREQHQMTVQEICEITGVSRSALYRELADHEIS